MCVPGIIYGALRCGENTLYHQRRGWSSKDAPSAWPSSSLKSLLTSWFKLLAREVVGWKWLQHKNVLPFIGVTPELAIVSDFMENGNIMEFIANHPCHNRLKLVSIVRARCILI